MTQLTVIILAIFVIASCIIVSDAAVSPIWMAPTNLNYPVEIVDSAIFNADIFENFTANLGEWATIEVATGARGLRPLSVMDSKGIIWILGGSMGFYSDFLTAVWNFDPKTDQYRYVWKTNNSSPFIARKAGELRVPAPSNHPGDLAFGTAAIDKDDNIWFYSFNSYCGELWMFNTSSWMFVRQIGSSSDSNNYEPSIGANPGQPGEDVWPGYTYGHCMVVDSNNDVWMMSGENPYDVTSSVWHFNTTSFLWTFVAGSAIPIKEAHNTTFYGGAWLNGCDIDDNDRVWIYGGQVSIGSVSGDYGDLWTFDTRTTREWEYEYGEDTYRTGPVVVSDDYDPGNRPPAAEGSALIDRRDGTLMLVPGSSDASSAYGNSNTVWQYSKSLKQWRLVYGDVSVDALNTLGNYSNFRAPGSVMPAQWNMAYAAGKHNGDLYLIGGSRFLAVGAANRKDIWLIPQDQCSNNLYTCDVNAECVEEMVGYSCKCKEGYTGDGFTCTVIPPVAVPMSAPTSAETPSSATPVATPGSTKTPSNKISSAALVGPPIVVTAAALGLFVGL